MKCQASFAALYLCVATGACNSGNSEEESESAPAATENSEESAEAEATAEPERSAAEPVDSVARMDPNPEYLLDGDVNTVAIAYVTRVPNVPEGTELLRLWLPVPTNSALQTITDLEFDGPVEAQLTVGREFGNRFAYFEIPNPESSVEFTMSFTAERREQLANLEQLAEVPATESNSAFLESGVLDVLNDEMREISASVVRGHQSTLAQARAIFDYVRSFMEYDKSGEGWGRGDTSYACDSARGNCTDYHSLFNALNRAAGIPSGFEIGLFLPYDFDESAELHGYHCWAHFEVPGGSWVGVDVSEADKDPERVDYFFGGVSNNRVSLSIGRDIVLEPAQAGPPLNFFVNPYAEADGRSIEATKTWSFSNVM
jgi:transglutaminase-like putative cysteine protease